jgi:LAO/AO transport system kinase
MTGGLSATIFAAIHVLEAYGCGRILIETIGTGQDEVEIGRVADSILYITAPSLGDEIQAMKAGAMEIADIFVVNKSELPGADKAAGALKSALDLGDHRNGPENWNVRVLSVSALLDQGTAELVKAVDEHQDYLRQSSRGLQRLRLQLKEELSLYISRRLYRDALSRISEKHLDMLQSKSADPVTLGQRLISKL